LLRKNH